MSERRTIAILSAALAVEAVIHLALFATTAALLLAYAVAFPSYAVFWAEGQVTYGWLLLGAGLAVGAAVFVARFRALTKTPSAVSRWTLWRASPVVSRVLGPLEPKLEILPANGIGAPFHSAFQRWCKLALPPGAAVPPLYWYLSERASARAVGTAMRPAIAVSHGLIGELGPNSELVSVVMLHELAHVRHRDPTVFASIRSFLVAWPAATAIVSALCLGYLLERADRPLFVALVLMVAAFWSATLVAAWIFLLRYAGFLFSLRELHADVAAARCVGTGEAFATTLAASYGGRGEVVGRLKSILSLRLTHLSGGERLAMLRRPTRVLMPKLRYFALSAGTVVLVQSSPFLTGFGNMGMILFLSLFGWAVATAILANCFSALWFSGQVGGLLGARHLAVLVVAAALAYHLPFMTLTGLSDLFLGPFFFGADFSEMVDQNRLRVAGALKDGVWVCSLTTAAVVLILTNCMLRRTPPLVDAENGLVAIYPVANAIGVGSALHLIVVLALRWESETPLPVIDRLTDLAYQGRHGLPVITLSTVFLVLFATMHRRFRRAHPAA